MQQSAEIGRAIGEATEIVMLWRKETRQELAVLLRMSTRSLGRRITGEIPWEAWEIAAMADHYRVPIERFFGGPDAVMTGVSPTTPAKPARNPRSTFQRTTASAAAA